jgi:alkanesulfonate monooxygenase SsuD/methylene tetrahydromethanopterin reductase-like flavin-dependent oxidoreductase (luciferase family)
MGLQKTEADAMEFGIFNLMGYRYRENSTPTPRLVKEATEQTQLADELGYEVAWFAEHHFSNYCICPSPLMMIAHCAPVTTHIRLGTAVVVVPLYDPARLLAEIGMTDAMCDGRLILGIGSGYQPYEFDRFGKDLEQSKKIMEEFMEMFDLAFTQETFKFDGEHFQLPETHISAQPVGGRPEVWLAGDNPVLHRLAARRGYVPLFTGRLMGPDYLSGMRRTIEKSWIAEGLDPDQMPLGIQRFMCVVDSRQEALEYVDNARHQMRLASNLRRREEVVDGAMLIEQPAPNEPTIDEAVDNLLVGDCETIAERLCAEIRVARPSHMMFHFQVGASSFKKALTSIEKFQTHIKPMVEKELGPLTELNNGGSSAQSVVA